MVNKESYNPLNEREEERKKIIEILKKFVKPRDVEDETEYKILESYATVGIVTFGFCFSERKVIAVLTARGRGLLGLEDE